MKKYVINEIYADGYERIAVIETIEHDVILNVHFIEFDEYLEVGVETKKKQEGDILEGNISIELVTDSEKVYEELNHYQEIPKSSHIKAVIEVLQVIDKYSIYARSSIIRESILIEFEDKVDYKIGDKVMIIGSLEITENE